MNIRAWLRASCQDAKYRDARKAIHSAKRACELTDWTDAEYIDTLAAAYAEAGDFEKAVEQEEKAIRLETDLRLVKQRKDRLAIFKDKKPYREQADR